MLTRTCKILYLLFVFMNSLVLNGKKRCCIIAEADYDSIPFDTTSGKEHIDTVSNLLFLLERLFNGRID